MPACPKLFNTGTSRCQAEQVAHTISLAGIALSIIGAIGAALILISPALPPIAAILLVLVPPVYIIHTGFFAVMFVALPKLIAGAVFTGAFMAPFGIAVAAVIGIGLLLVGTALLVHHCIDRPAAARLPVFS